MKTKVIGIGFGMLIAIVLVVNLAQSQSVPQLINYQGRLTNAGGQPINGSREMRFKLLDGNTSSATLLWGETQSLVQVNQGIYNVLLGSVKAIPGSALSGNTVYLEVNVAGETLRPRQRLTSVAYAYRAVNAVNAVDSAKLGGQDAGQFYSKAQVDALIAGLQSQITNEIGNRQTADSTLTTNLANEVSRAVIEDSFLQNEVDIEMVDRDSADNALSNRITPLETKLASVSVVGSDFIFTNVNVNIRSGSGTTDGAINGKGNLIVGYNENNARTRTGSHNLIVGKYNGYASYGGIVAGQGNEIHGTFASVLGGRNNFAMGNYSSVSGGGGFSAPEGNAALGDYSAVGGGTAVTAGDIQGWEADSVRTNVADLQGRMTTAEGNITNLQGRMTTVETKLQPVTVTLSGSTVTNFYFTGTNVHVRSGSGSTTGAVNGKGNLIIGYNESNGDTKTGSHNLVVGPNHSYTSYAGAVIGGDNTISAVFASVTGGNQNIASGQYSSVNGGSSNTASGSYAVVGAGYINRAYANRSAVMGGSYNIAGDESDHANGLYATISGGQNNLAKGEGAHVSGGMYNIASGAYSFVGGGGLNNNNFHNEAFADYSAILGGARNITGDSTKTDHSLGPYSAVVGGWFNVAGGDYSAVLGGGGNSALGQDSTIGGGTDNTVGSSTSYATVSGGNVKSATSDFQWVGGTYRSPP